MPAQTPIPLAALNAALANSIPAVARMGIELVSVERGRVSSRVPFEGNGNHFGVMYAGVLFSVAEVLGGAIGLGSFDATRFYPLVKSVTIKFQRPARSAVTAAAALDEAELTRVAEEADANGKADFGLEVVLTDAAGTVVAVTQGLYQLRSIGR